MLLWLSFWQAGNHRPLPGQLETAVTGTGRFMGSCHTALAWTPCYQNIATYTQYTVYLG